MKTLLESIHAAWSADPALALAFPGGFWADAAPEGTAMPYVIHSVQAAPATCCYGTARHVAALLRLTVYGIGHDAMLALSEELASSFRDVPVTLFAGQNYDARQIADPRRSVPGATPAPPMTRERETFGPSRSRSSTQSATGNVATRVHSPAAQGASFSNRDCSQEDEVFMIVPGSTIAVNHPFAWYALVRDRKTGRRFTYWMNGSQITRELVAQHIAAHFPGVELLTCDPCTAPPAQPLRPIPPEHYEFGIRVKAEAEMGIRSGAVMRRQPIARMPILR